MLVTTAVLKMKKKINNMKHLKTFEQFVSENQDNNLDEGLLDKLKGLISKKSTRRPTDAEFRIASKFAKEHGGNVGSIGVNADDTINLIVDHPDETESRYKIDKHGKEVNESVRHVTKYFWTIDKNRKIETYKTNNDLEEEAASDNADRDDNIIAYGFAGNESGAKSMADNTYWNIKRFGKPKNKHVRQVGESVNEAKYGDDSTNEFMNLKSDIFGDAKKEYMDAIKSKLQKAGFKVGKIIVDLEQFDNFSGDGFECTYNRIPVEIGMSNSGASLAVVNRINGKYIDGYTTKIDVLVKKIEKLLKA